jgi:hypothetical protein
MMGLGVEPITGKPYKPTTQGKNERFHQTLFRYLDKQPLASSLAELQTQVDAFDHIYNTERPHQGLPGRITPQAAWEATAKAEAPRPTRGSFTRRVDPRSGPAATPAPAPAPTDLPDDTQVKKLTTAGTFSLNKVHYKVDGRRALEAVLVITDGDKITVTDLHGEILIEHTRPGPGVTYVGNGRPRGPQPNTSNVTDVLRH